MRDLELIAALPLLFVLVVILTGCQSTGPVIGSCPPDRCIGPYDLTLSSHREALAIPGKMNYPR